VPHSALWKGNSYSNEKLKKMLGWEPKIAFANGSKMYFDYLRKVGGYK